MAQARDAGRDTPGRRAVSKKAALAVQKTLEEQGISLAEFLKAMGLTGVRAGGEVAKRESRKAMRAAWHQPRELTGGELATIRALPKKVGSSVQPGEPRALTQDEVDALMEEVLPIRDAQDILGGRHEAIREIVFGHVTLTSGGDEDASGTLRARQGMKFEKRVHFEQDEPDLNALRGVVDDVTWRYITKTERVVDERRLARALDKGRVTLDQVRSILPEPRAVRKFFVKPIKPGEEAAL
jgi:hypothetical protein